MVKALFQELGRDGASYLPKERGREWQRKREKERERERRRGAREGVAGQWGQTGAREDQLTLGTLVARWPLGLRTPTLLLREAEVH